MLSLQFSITPKHAACIIKRLCVPLWYRSANDCHWLLLGNLRKHLGWWWSICSCADILCINWKACICIGAVPHLLLKMSPCKLSQKNQCTMLEIYYEIPTVFLIHPNAFTFPLFHQCSGKPRMRQKMQWIDHKSQITHIIKKVADMIGNWRKFGKLIETQKYLRVVPKKLIHVMNSWIPTKNT